MRAIFLFLSLAFLASCGAAGQPIAPKKAETTPGIRISGGAIVGISIVK
jgi:hypothetical protein